MPLSLKNYSQDVVSLAAGALLVLAFAPFNVWPLGLFCPAALLWSFQSASPLRALLRGSLFGIGLFGFGISWVFVSIYTFGGASIAVSLLITSLFILSLSSLFALQGYLLQKCCKRPLVRDLFWFPLSWLVFELARSSVFTGFPWLLIGYSQTNSPLAGFMPLFGVFGVSFISVTLSALLVLAISKPILRGLSILSISIIFLLAYGLSHIEWTQPHGKPVNIALVQGDISQTLKWDPNAIGHIFSTYYSLTNSNWKELVIWPENAIPMLPEQADQYLTAMNSLALMNKSTLLIGMPTAHGNDYFNSAVVLGNGNGQYNKRHLVPFGEYVPLNRYFGRVLQFLNIPMSSFTPGTQNQTLISLQDIPTAVFICYEIAYGLEVRDHLGKASLIVTIADDSWFGHSLGAAQQAQTAQARALETGRYVLSGSNDGITEIIAPNGKVVSSLPRYTAQVLNGSITPMVGATPWLRYGLWSVLILALLAKLFSFYITRKFK